MTDELGVITHAEMETSDSGGVIMLATPTPLYRSPLHLRELCPAVKAWSEAPWVINGVMVHVPDIDAHYARTKAAGAILLSEIEDAPPGRLYRVEDFEGQRWMFLQLAE